MRVIFKNILAKLLNTHKSKTKISQAIEQQSQDQSHDERCQNILNYWLDIELFELPECPFQNKKDILSVEAELFKEKMSIDLQEKVHLDPDLIKKDSRLVIMFQCHKAGYIAEGVEPHPNFIIPRTYLVSHSFVPTWDAENKSLKWALSPEEKDLIINLSTIRTIYRKCQLSAAQNMTLPQWITTCVDEIENLFKVRFHRPETNHLFSTDELQTIIKQINRGLAGRFWPEKQAQNFMQKHCQSIEESYETDLKDKDDPVIIDATNELTFRWRFCFYPDGNETQQLGPFFVKDLESCILKVENDGVNGLSPALQRYLMGSSTQSYVPQATQHGEYFKPYIQRIPMGRWLSSPDYGLSLLQSFAVNVAKDIKQNPVVAVNGPPGTGKTTLLKDIIADRFVQRTYQLLKLHEANKSILDDEAIHEIMNFSTIVASSNNKAVENISKELPARSNIDAIFLNDLSHFSSIAGQDEWGLFCAVLGNAANRKEFKNKIKHLRYHLKNINDIYRLNPFIGALKKKDTTEERLSILKKQITFWKDHHKISNMISDFDECSNAKKYASFYDPFKKALCSIEKDTLAIDDFVKFWEVLTEEQWSKSIEAIEKIKSQWFAKKLFQKHHQEKLNHTKTAFVRAYKRIDDCLGSADQFILNTENIKQWELDAQQHLTQPEAFDLTDGIHENIFEQQLQKRSPYGSKKLNQSRSDLFCAAINFNEALIESHASEIEVYFDDMLGLIDGLIESNENPPEHKLLWSVLFLFFPVISTSLSSVENQFKLMQRAEGFGLAMIDEAGQAVNYHVVGLLQRCKQAIFVGDPIQLEPVVTIPHQIDQSIAHDYVELSKEYSHQAWGDHYLISKSSAQSIADLASNYYSTIGSRKVGIPLLVHRRCLEPMFSISNSIAYDNKMVSATSSHALNTLKFIPSGWINVEESLSDIKKQGYSNNTESKTALELIQYLVENQAEMVQGGIFVITPFSVMRKELTAAWYAAMKNNRNHHWMSQAFGAKNQHKDLKEFVKDNIGTVHTFQGKEASTVILCLAASELRKKNGGITWVNSKPNLINVAVTRAKSHFFVIGHQDDWSKGVLSADLQSGYMHVYKDLSALKAAKLIDYATLLKQEKLIPVKKESFYFGA